MSNKSHPGGSLVGQSFRDTQGQRWWVRGARPGPEHQIVVEAEVKSSYPRVDLYVMTEREFHDRARAAGFRPEAGRRHPR